MTQALEAGYSTVCDTLGASKLRKTSQRPWLHTYLGMKMKYSALPRTAATKRKIHRIILTLSFVYLLIMFALISKEMKIIGAAQNVPKSCKCVKGTVVNMTVA
jgi:hypothetical protein